MTFFNVNATPGLGKRKNLLQKQEISYGQAKLSINANPLNGNLFVRDFTQPFIEQNFQLDIGYHYNSQSKLSWRLNQGKIIGSMEGNPNEIDSFVMVEEADGFNAIYNYDPDRNCYIGLSETGTSSILTYSEGQWEGWNPLSNFKERYNTNNQIEKLTDASGNSLTYQYDNYDRLILISAPSGRTVEIEYSSSTTAIYFTDSNKNKTLMANYLFDEENQLKQTTIPINIYENYEINFTYSNNLLESITQDDETTVSFDYEIRNDLPHLNSLTNGADHYCSLHYENGVTKLIDSLGNTETFSQNDAGLLKKHRHNDQYQRYLYDDQHRIKTIEYQDGSSQQFNYDEIGCYSKLIDRCGEKTLFHRDTLSGLLLCETQVLSNGDNEKHLNTFYIYNDNQALVFKIMPNGAVYEYCHDDRGNCIQQKIYLNELFDLSHLTRKSKILPAIVKEWCEKQNQAMIALSEWTYNEYGKKISETMYATIGHYGVGIHDEFTAYHEYEWNNYGDNLTQKTRLNTQEIAIHSVEYDGLSRPTKEINAQGQVTTHTYRENQHLKILPTGLVITTIWNSGGQVTEQQEQSNEYTKSNILTYDSAGRVCIIEKENGAKEYLIHDETDRILYRIDSIMRVTKSVYDSNNHLIHLYRYTEPLIEIDETALKMGAWQPEPEGDYCIESTLYNASGQLVCSINGDNFVTEYCYDTLGNTIQTIEYATLLYLTEEEREILDTLPEIEKSDQDRIHRFYFNEANHLIGEQTPIGQVIAYYRNAKGDLLHKKTTLGVLPLLTDWNATVISKVPHKTEEFKLDALGQCLQQSNAEGIITTKTLDAGGRLIKSNCNDETQEFVWDAMNHLVIERHSSGLEIRRSYAPCGEIASEVQTDLIAGTSPRSNYIRYNGFGQVTHELSPRAALKLSNPVIAEDPLLVESLWQNESVRHTYDPVALKSSTHDELGNISYFYYNTAQELCVTISPTGSITEYTYDAIFHQCESTRFYANCLNEDELVSLKGGLLTPELISLFHNKQSDQDALESVKYNKRGLIALKIDAEQFTIQKQYDAFNNLRVLQQQIDTDNELICHMEYDKANRPITKIRDVDDIQAMETWIYIDEENLVIYRDANHHISKTYYDTINRKIKEINGLNDAVTFVWDPLSRLKETTDALQNTTIFKYENHGRKITTVGMFSRSIIEKNAFGEIEVEQNADDELWQKVYDVDGQIKTKIDPDGNQITYRYNLAGWLTEVIDPLNKVTCYQHNKSGHILRQIAVGLNKERALIFKRDSQGREILRTDENGIATATIYDKRGLETDKIIDPVVLALCTHYEYDGLGNLVKEIKGDSQYPNQLITQFVRDKLGRVSHIIIDPYGLQLTTRMIYDHVGNCIEIIDPNHHSSRTYYDAANHERYLIDPMGGVIEKIYDFNGRCIEERHYLIPLDLEMFDELTLADIKTLLSPNHEDKIFYYAYDADNNQIASLDQNGKLTRYSYNAQGKKTHEVSYATPMTKTEFMVVTPAARPKDRQSAWFYDGRGNERFVINGEGIVTEQRWNEKGWLIEERTYATPYFDYAHFPISDMLEHQDDRSIHYIHDEFGRVIFEIDGGGYVTEYDYDHSDKPTTTWFYQNTIVVPQSITLTSIRELLPTKEKIPFIQTEFDAASRKVAAIDQLNYREEFKLDALDNLREYIDKGGDSWTFDIDAAGRKIAETTPPVEVTSVTKQGQLINPTGKQRIIKKIEYAGSIQRITEAYGTKDARTLELHQNPCNQTIKIVQQDVLVHDKAIAPSRFFEEYIPNSDKKPGHETILLGTEKKKTLSTITRYNAFQKPIVTIDEAGNPRFKVYKADKLRYEIDQEGFVTSYEYNVFGNIIQLTRHAKAIDLDLKTFATTGVPFLTVAASITNSDQNRSIFFEFDNANRPIKTSQDSVYVSIPQSNGEAQYGECTPVKINEYNAFGEIYSQRELVDPFYQQWDVTRTWFNKSGYAIAQVDGLNYLTLFDPDRYGNNKKVVEYAKKLILPLKKEYSINELVQGLEVDAEYDRIYSNEINARGEVVTMSQHKVRLYDAELDVSSISNPILSSDKQTVEHSFIYNAKGRLIHELLPNGSNKTTEYDARNLPVLKTEPARLLEAGTATPVITMAYNAFGQPTRVTHHKNPYENQAYLTASSEDQIHITGYDSRGLQVITINPEGAVHYQNFTETKKLASSWIWVSGWGANAALIKRLHQTSHDYDKRGIETLRCEAIEGGTDVITATRSNAFGEKIAQGAGDGSYPVYWLHDKTGKVWNTNEQNGVPVITLCDARGQETLILRSRTCSLKDVLTFNKLQEIIVLDYRSLQRLELHRDVKGNIEAQALPAFKTLTTHAPEPYSTEVTSGSLYQEFGKVSLSWPIPDIKGLESEIIIWPKGHEEESKRLPVLTSKTRCGIDVSQLPIDDYQYQIDFYYRDPQNGQRDAFSRYRADGSAFIITEKVAATQNLVWHQIDEQRLMFHGTLGDVSGIELLQAGISVGRAAISNTENPGCWMIDLSDKPSGRYEFRLLRGYSLLDEQPIALGVPSPKGTRIDDITTHLAQATHVYADELNTLVTSAWDNLPPQISNAYQELTVINTYVTDINPYFVTNYVTPKPYLISINTQISGSSQFTIHNQIPNGFCVYATLFSCTISRNRLYTIDEKNQQYTIADIVNPLIAVNNANSSFLYVQPGAGLPRADALREHAPNGHMGKTIALSPWMNQSSRCVSSLVNHNSSYDLISLQANIPDPVSCGEITIHTANIHSKKILVREIALTKTMVSKVKTNYSEDGYSTLNHMRNALNFKWTLPGFLASSPVKVNVQLRFHIPYYKSIYGDQHAFEYIVGKAHHTPYNGHLLPYLVPMSTPAFTDFDLSYLNMYVQYNDDWIPILHSDSFTMDRSVHKKPFSMAMQVTAADFSQRLPIQTWTETIINYDEGDVATFQDAYTLLFYPLPSGIDGNTISIEYSDNSLPSPDWRKLTDAHYTGHAISAPANAINPGIYQYRLKAKNNYGVDIDFSEIAEQYLNGWAMGHFSVAHGGTLTTVKRTTPSQDVLRPVRKQDFDRWGNVVKSTNAMGDATYTTYNGRNKPLRKTEPTIEITEENGVKKTINPQTHTVYDLSDSIIAISDPNRHMTYHERDNDGKTLKTILADGVFKRFILDIFGRTRTIRDPFNHDINHYYDRCNQEIMREDECHWKTFFSYNEQGNRLSVTKGPAANGKTETERYDYLHPSGQLTHHYLAEGDFYKTIKHYERHGVMTKEELPDHRQNTWTLDEFGNIQSHTDLGGALYTYTLNPFYPTEVLKITSKNIEHHGNRMSADGSTKPMANQDLVYQYDEASHVVSILDNALPLTTLYRYDLEGRRARETFRASDGHIHQAVLMKWNALGWLEEVQDTVMLVKYTHDAKGNRRSTIASVYWDDTWHAIGDENWYTYTASDAMAINRGLLLKDGTIQIAPNHGTKLLYDIGGRRNHELTIKSEGIAVDKTLFYLDNHLLRRTESTNGDVAGYQYDGQIARRKELTTNSTKQECDYLINGWLTGERNYRDAEDIRSKTTYYLNPIGSPYFQFTTVRNKEGTDGYDDSVKTTYVQFDTDKISNVHATRQRVNGKMSEGTVKTFYDPNSNLETVLGDEQETRHFITNSKGRIVKKTVGQDKEEYYFYTTTDQPLGRFGNIPPDGFKAELTHVDFDLNYHPVSEHFPPPTPGTCLVMAGDTFSLISERVYGDASFANLIADTNGFRKEDNPPVGLMLQIPNIVNTNIHNWEGQYPIYNPGAIIGSLYPNMPIPQRTLVTMTQPSRPHRKFWHVLVEAIAGAAIMAFAPELAGVFSGFLSGLLGELLGFAVAGAAANLAQQELAIGFGDQKGLSLNAIGQSALLAAGTAGIAKGLGMDLMKSPQYRSLLDAAAKNVELTIATQGLSFATGQQRHFEWRIMLGSVVSALANVGIKQTKFSTPVFNDALASASGSVASIGVDALFGSNMDIEAVAANTLGTLIGNQLAAQAKQYYAEYQTKKALEAQFHASQIPAIQQELEAYEQYFIQSKLAHSNALHNSASSSSSQRNEHHTSSTKTAQASQRNTNSNSATKTPPHDHILTKRAHEEALMSHSSRWNSDHSPTKSQQPRPSQRGFWSMVDKAAHSRMVSTINEIGDKAAHSMLDMLNPVKQFKTAMTDSTESIRAFRNGEILHGLASTGETALDLLGFVPFGKVAASEIRYGVKGISEVGSRLGLFGDKTIVPNSLPLRAHIESNIAQTRAGIKSSVNFLEYDRRTIAREFYVKGGWDSELISSHLNGIDFPKDVSIEAIPKGTLLQQHQMLKDPIGNYFSVPGAERAKLGIYTSGRATRNYVTTSNVYALSSTTGNITDFWSMLNYKWEIKLMGGEKQYFTHNTSDWRLVP